MISKLVETLGAFVIWGISASGHLGVVLMMAIESACIPLPSEIIMPFSGYLVYTGRFSSLWLVATLGAIGCNLGSVVAYEIGYYGGRPLVERWGRYILLNERDLNFSDRFFRKYGDITVFISRLLPVVRTFIALPAGIARMPRLRFHVYTFIGSWPWCYLLAYVGLKLGEKWNQNSTLKTWFHRFDFAIAGLILAGVVWFVWSHWQHRVRVEETAAVDSGRGFRRASLAMPRTGASGPTRSKATARARSKAEADASLRSACPDDRRLSGPPRCDLRGLVFSQVFLATLNGAEVDGSDL